MSDSWKDYWSAQNDPRHSENSERFFEAVAKAISFHLGDISDKKILEIGCGDGALLGYLGIESSQYTGIDFSTSLLERFRDRFPAYTVVESDAFDFLKNSDQTFDLIFSFGVLQYFSHTELGELFEEQSHCLKEDGVAWHFGIPVKEYKRIFTSGLLARNSITRKRGLLKRIKSACYNKIGYWHSLDKLCGLSQRSGYTTEVVGGINYLYRINMVQSK